VLERQCLPQSECDDEKFHQPLPTAAVCLRFPLLLESRSSGRNCGGPSPKSKPSARGARNPSGTQRLIVQYYSTKASVQRSHPQQIESHQRPNTKRHTGSFMVALDLVQQRLTDECLVSLVLYLPKSMRTSSRAIGASVRLSVP
jgi:hypothetical protein